MIMKRGLSSFPDGRDNAALYAQRIGQVRRLCGERGLDAVVVYGTVARGSDIAYLTHAMLYWAEAALLVPAEGPVTLVKVLGPRTNPWMQATSTVDELRCTADVAGTLADVIEAGGYRVVGLDGAADLPHPLGDVLGRRGIETVDLEGRVRGMRLRPDAATTEDTRALALSVQAAAEQAGRLTSAAMTRFRADFEHALRVSGAWDVLIDTVPGPATQTVFRVRCQLRDAWVAIRRTVGEDGPLHPGCLDAVTSIAAGGLTTDAVAERLRSVLPPASGAADDREVLVRMAPDIEWQPVIGGGPAEPIPDGAVLYIELREWADGRLQFAHGDTFVARTDTLEQLTRPLGW